MPRCPKWPPSIQVFWWKLLMHFLSPPCMLHIPPTPWFKIANNVWWRGKIMRLLTVHLSQAFHFLHLRSKYFPQHPILQWIFKKQYQNLDLHIKYDLLYYVLTTIQGGVFLHLKAGNQEGNSNIPCTNNKVKMTNIWYPSALTSLINR